MGEREAPQPRSLEELSEVLEHDPHDVQAMREELSKRIGSDFFLKWVNEPNSSFGGRTPGEIFDTGDEEGLTEMRLFLNELRYGPGAS